MRCKKVRKRQFSLYMSKKLYYSLKIYQDSIDDEGSLNRCIVSLLEKSIQKKNEITHV